MKRLIERTRHKFHISVAEGGFQDIIKTGNVTLCGLAHHSAYAHSILDQIENFISGLHQGDVEVLEKEVI